MYIGGEGLARGYLNRPELTAEKFLPDPFSQAAGARMYRTGDRARWLWDGNIEYMGRLDEQVKIRGYRIELGEIEQVVLQSGLAEQVVVMARDEVAGNGKQLVGYVTGRSPEDSALPTPAKKRFDKEALLAYLGARLPSYMVPQRWVELPGFPLTGSGKIDKKGLPSPELSEGTGVYTAPRNENEEKLAHIWQELMAHDRIGIYDNFFELGGHSLLAVRILGRISRELDVTVSLYDFFRYPTVAGLSHTITVSRAANAGLPPSAEPIPAAPVAADYPLSSGQARLWITQQLTPGNYSYNIVQSYHYQGKLQPEVLQAALDRLVERHEILRTRFVLVEGEPRQRILPLAEGRILLQYPGAPTERRPPATVEKITGKTLLQQESTFVFDLSKDPLLRIHILQTGPTHYRLIVNLHHIITDEWSTEILLREWQQAYDQLISGSEPSWLPQRIQYKDYAVWQQAQLQGAAIETMRSFWLDQFRGEIPVLELPVDFARPAAPDAAGHSITYAFPPALSQSLRELAAEQEASLYMTLLSLIQVLLYKYTGQSTIITGTPTLGREHPDLDGQVGFFVNTLPVIGRIDGEESFTSLLQRTKEQVLSCYAHQLYPFELLVSELNIPREVNRNPLFDVMVSYTPEAGDNGRSRPADRLFFPKRTEPASLIGRSASRYGLGVGGEYKL